MAKAVSNGALALNSGIEVRVDPLLKPSEVLPLALWRSVESLRRPQTF